MLALDFGFHPWHWVKVTVSYKIGELGLQQYVKVNEIQGHRSWRSAQFMGISGTSSQNMSTINILAGASEKSCYFFCNIKLVGEWNGTKVQLKIRNIIFLTFKKFLNVCFHSVKKRQKTTYNFLSENSTFFKFFYQPQKKCLVISIAFESIFGITSYNFLLKKENCDFVDDWKLI